MSLKLNYYISSIKNIRRASYKGKAVNAKPILLLSTIICIQRGIITNNMILCDNQLVDVYKNVWLTFEKDMSILTPIYKPYYFLHSDGFWNFKWMKKTIFRDSISAKFIRDHIEYAYFDEDLWELLQEESSRKEIMKVLIKLIENK